MSAIKNLFKPFRKSQNRMSMEESKSSTRTEETMKPTEKASDTTPTTGTRPQPSSPSGQPTVLLELFQSQGCNSCPPANSNAINLACARDGASPPSADVAKVLAAAGIGDGADVLLLTYHVTYWDYLGWRDTFGAAAFDARQRDYVRRMGLRSAFTPQVIVNGRASGVGSSKSDMGRILREGCAGSTGAGAGAGAGAEAVTVTVDGSVAAVSSVGLDAEDGSGGAPSLEVLLVYFDPAAQDVKIQRGENRGRTLPHLNIVTDVKRIGQLQRGGEQAFDLKEPRKGLRAAVLVQDGPGGPILAAVRV